MKIIKWSLFSVILLCQACMSRYETPEHVKKVCDITESYIQERYDSRQLTGYGFGGGFMHNVETISLYFHKQGEFDVPAARQLIIECIENLKERINQDLDIQPYLNETPFPASALEISISFIDKNRNRAGNGYVALAFQVRDKLFYCRHDPIADRLEDLYEEPYEEALKIVQSTH